MAAADDDIRTNSGPTGIFLIVMLSQRSRLLCKTHSEKEGASHHEGEKKPTAAKLASNRNGLQALALLAPLVSVIRYFSIDVCQMIDKRDGSVIRCPADAG